jgi:hypothetical protein
MEVTMKNTVLLLGILAVVVLFTPNLSQADILVYNGYKIKEIWTIGDRDDNGPHKNKLLIVIKNDSGQLIKLGGMYWYAYLENTHPDYRAILSVALAAQM